MMSMPPADNLRQVAILIATLDSASADSLLDQMPDSEAAEVRRLLLELEDVALEEQQEVFAQFLALEPSAANASAAESSAGVELCLSTAAESAELPDLHLPEKTELVSSANCSAFAFLDGVPRSQLANFLAAERSQTIALVISQLPEANAMAVLAELPKGLQREVTRRWLDLGCPDPEVLTAIAQEMRKRLFANLAVQIDPPATRHESAAPGPDAKLRRQLLSHLNQSATPAPSLDAPSLAFEDLEYLSDAGLSSLLDATDQATLVLALAGATESFSERVARQLPSGEAKQLLRAINSLGPTRLADIEFAQQQLAATARQLLAECAAVVESPLPSGPLG